MGEIQFIVLIIVLAFAQWLFSHLIKVSLEKSIQHKYEKRLEDHKFNQIQKQKAESVARLFARWIKYRGHEEKFLDTKELIEYLKKEGLPL